jgi:hypothetical protein
MSPVLTLQVPVDAPFQALAAEAAGRVLACAGGAPEAIEQLRAAVADAVGAVSTHGTEIQLTVESTPDGITVHVSCGTASRQVRQTARHETS